MKTLLYLATLSIMFLQILSSECSGGSQTSLLDGYNKRDQHQSDARARFM